jgi:hypothetical protein
LGDAICFIRREPYCVILAENYTVH